MCKLMPLLHTFYKENIPMHKICIILFACITLSVGCNTHQQKSSDTFVPIAEDAHSFANFNEARTTHLDLDLKVNFEERTLTGSATWKIERQKDAEYIILDIGQLVIQKITLDNDDSAQYTLGPLDSIKGQSLTITLKPTTSSITIYYNTLPDSKALQWLTPDQTLGKVHPFLFSQSQAILARTWVPCQDAPGVKFTYNATIRTDSNLLALMSAENDTTLRSDGVYEFKMKQPISSYLLALTVGDLKFASTGRNSGIYAEPAMLNKAVWELASMQSMIDSAEALYGPYAWGRYDVVILPPSFPFGGMENPRLTFATPTIIAGDRSLVSLIAHELAHSWSGNLVTNETWNDFWLNEGFTVYFEQRIMEKVFGVPYSQMLTKLGMGDLELTIADLINDGKPEETHLYLNLDHKDPDDGLTDVAYEKGRFFLQTIESIVGRARFDAFLKKYFEENKFKPMNTKKFISYLNDNLLTNEEERSTVKIDEWIYGPGIPDNAPEVTSAELDRVELAIAKYNNNRIKAVQIDVTGYTTHHWLYFLRGLKNLNLTKMAELDAAFQFTKTGNSEIACDWFKHCIDLSYKPAYPAIESFLTRVGRRKFLTPLYERLAKTTEDKIWAQEVFKKAKLGYHSVSYNSVNHILY